MLSSSSVELPFLLVRTSHSPSEFVAPLEIMFFLESKDVLCIVYVLVLCVMGCPGNEVSIRPSAKEKADWKTRKELFM